MVHPLCCCPVQVDDTAASVLHLVLSRSQEQLALAAHLLPLSSSMPQLLAGCMQLDVAANTCPRACLAAAWLRKYGCLLTSLKLDAVVDCCAQDAGRANAAVAGAAAASNQVRPTPQSKHACLKHQRHR